MKVAILYICTGKYSDFFSGFYDSAEKYFLKGIANLEYFIFTDNLELSKEKNVHIIFKKCMGFPLDSLFRFEMFMSLKDQLSGFDYIYFFNANTEFRDFIGKEILPLHGEGLVAAEWPKLSKIKKIPCFFPYERNKDSLAYIAPYERKTYRYFMGGINGGESCEYLRMIETLSNNIRLDYEHKIIAKVHDESHINKYFRTHSCMVLPPEYSWPEEWNSTKIPKIVFRDKVKLSLSFRRGRDVSFLGKLRTRMVMLLDAIKWYL